MFNNKKGAELPMNTIIIAVIVVVVLFVIIVFFLGGTSAITQKIYGVFSGATAGMDVKLAEGFCNDYCEQQNKNAYCYKSFKVDHDENSKTPPEVWKCHTKSKPETVTIKDIEWTSGKMENFGVSCSIDC